MTDKILAKDPNSFDGLRLSGQIALLKKDTKTAVAQLQHANQLKPNSSDVVLAYFEALVRNDQKDAAEKMLLEFDRSRQNFCRGLRPAVLPVHGRQTARRRRADPEAEGRKQSQVAELPAPTGDPLCPSIVNRRADMDAVIRTLTDEKQFPDGHLMAGDFYFFRLRDFELAKQQYEAGIAALPKDKAVYQKRLVELYATTGNNAEANQMVDVLLKENPKDTDAIAMHAALLLTSGKKEQVDQAAIDLQSLVSKTPNNHLLRFNYARALLAQESDRAGPAATGRRDQDAPGLRRCERIAGSYLSGQTGSSQGAPDGQRPFADRREEPDRASYAFGRAAGPQGHRQGPGRARSDHQAIIRITRMPVIRSACWLGRIRITRRPNKRSGRCTGTTTTTAD